MSETQPQPPTIDLTPVLSMINQLLPSIIQIAVISMVIGLIFNTLIPTLREAFTAR